MDGAVDGAVAGDGGWTELAAGYERARGREDSLDRLVEWPAQRDLLGDVAGLSILDLGCGNGAKLVELAAAGAGACVGVDVGGSFVDPVPPGVELHAGDLNDLDAVGGLAGPRFDRILFLQSFGYAEDPVAVLRRARSMLTDDGWVLLTRTQPVRYALERAADNGTTLGEEYFATDAFDYRHRSWDGAVVLRKKPYTMADLLNTFSAAGFWVETVVEPQLTPEQAARYPHKKAVLDAYLGILVFRLRPLTGPGVAGVAGGSGGSAGGDVTDR